VKLRSVDQLNVPAIGKLHCGFREPARGHHESARRSPRGHHAVKFSHDTHADAESPPLLTLNQEPLACLRKNHINAAVRTAAPGLFHPVALKPKRLAYQHLELPPAHSIDHPRCFADGGIPCKPLPLSATERRNQSSSC
jgi:hypothetical protein